MRRILAATTILMVGADFVPVVEQVPSVPTGWYRLEAVWKGGRGYDKPERFPMGRTYYRFGRDHFDVYTDNGNGVVWWQQRERMKIDARREPGWIDLAGPSPGLDEFHGHELVLCLGEKRPNSFSLRNNDGSKEECHYLRPCGVPEHLKGSQAR